jgi:hypothetical protein
MTFEYTEIRGALIVDCDQVKARLTAPLTPIYQKEGLEVEKECIERIPAPASMEPRRLALSSSERCIHTARKVQTTLG